MIFLTDNIIYSRLDYQKTTDFINELTSKYNVPEKIIIGHSALGREIAALKFGKSPNTVLYAACFHPLEDLTVNLMLKFSEDLASLYERGDNAAGINLAGALNERSLVIIPLINPDGLEIRRKGFGAAGKYEKMLRENTKAHCSLWNANARGVDLNHNFDAGHSILKAMLSEKGFDVPRERFYAGEEPESEPETKAICDFCRSHRVVSVYAFHSQGEEIFYSYGERTPKKSALIAEMLSSFSGYTLSHPSGTASHGGFKDWFIKEFARPGFTFEIGKGENPLPLCELDRIYSDLFEALVYGIIL